jgi:hypothetical protein
MRTLSILIKLKLILVAIAFSLTANLMGQDVRMVGASPST